MFIQCVEEINEPSGSPIAVSKNLHKLVKSLDIHLPLNRDRLHDDFLCKVDWIKFVEQVRQHGQKPMRKKVARALGILAEVGEGTNMWIAEVRQMMIDFQNEFGDEIGWQVHFDNYFGAEHRRGA